METDVIVISSQSQEQHATPPNHTIKSSNKNDDSGDDVLIVKSVNWLRKKRERCMNEEQRNVSPIPTPLRHQITIVSEFLAPDLAKSVLEHSLTTATKDWSQKEITVFSRHVMTPRLSSSYIIDPTLRDMPFLGNYSGTTKSGADAELAPGFLRPVIDAVNTYVQSVMGRTDWSTNAVVCNYYRNGDDNTGWHSDTLTNIGPRPLIVSLSFGGTRRFQFRNVLEGKKKSACDYSVPLSHNMLCVMHGLCQESYQHRIPPETKKHAVPPRVNYTFRMYQTDLMRRVPMCRCNRPTVMRSTWSATQQDVKQEIVKEEGASLRLRYFFSCNRNADESCDYFKWMDG
eukprot:PhF_6_TR27375/c0_g1_i1/m.40276